MFVLDWLASWINAKHIEVAAAEVALRCRDSVWERVREQVIGMGKAEALGYTRAHARPILALATKSVVDSHRRLNALAYRRITSDYFSELAASFGTSNRSRAPS